MSIVYFTCTELILQCIVVSREYLMMVLHMCVYYRALDVSIHTYIDNELALLSQLGLMLVITL